MNNQDVSDWVARFSDAVPADASVLDLACGSGCHTWFFASSGHPVTAVDKGISRLVQNARPLGVEMIEADLEDGPEWPFAGRTFGAIVVTNYLHRPLFPLILEALQPGGVLIYETFAIGNERYGKPSRPAFLLKPGELLEMVSGTLRVLAYEHGKIEVPRPAIVQRICAVRPEPMPL